MTPATLASSAGRVLSLLGLLALASACAPAMEPGPESEQERFGDKGAAVVDSILTADGWLSLEDEYVPRVCTQENGGAAYLALEAQAIAARTYLLRAMRDDPALGVSKAVTNGESFQAFAASANEGCLEAAKATRGVMARYQGELIIANYVAGSRVNEDGSLGSDYSGTEHWVTYNEGLSGSAVKPTALSYKQRSDNRGCMSQNRAGWLAEHGYDTPSILRYFYGADLELDGYAPGDGGSGTVANDDPCKGIDYAGACEGDKLLWCENGALNSASCGDKGQTCGWQSDAIGNNCLDKASGCGDLTYEGNCDGAVLSWCEGGEAQTYNCASIGMSCGWVGSMGNNCL